MYQKNDKDCMNAVLSMLLDIEYEKIPKFYEKEKVDLFYEYVDKWLNENDMMRLTIDVRYEDEVIKLPFDISEKEIRCIGILKKKTRTYSHAVLLTIKKNNDKFDISMHDVKEKSEYTIEDILQVEFIIKKFPKCVK